LRSNFRLAASLLIANTVLAAVLWGLSGRSSVVAVTTRSVLVPFDTGRVDGITVRRAGAAEIRLAREAAGEWRLVAPYSVRAERAVVLRLADALTLTPVGDVLSDGDLRDLGRVPSDFGLDPAVVAVTVEADGKSETVFLGSAVPSGRERYARIDGIRNVFTVPADVLAAVPTGPDDCRSRRLFAIGRTDVVEMDFRSPGSPFVKLACAEGAWSLRLPVPAPADAASVASVFDALYGARVSAFVWPNASDAPEADAVRKPATAERLAPYGLDEAGASVALRGSGDIVERVVFGASAGSNLVYALVADGTEIVTIPDTVVECCRAGEGGFRDTRLFAFPPASAKTVSFAVDARVFTLARDTNGVWSLAAPVCAPVDAVVAEDVLARTFAIRSSDSVPASEGVKVTVTAEKGVSVSVSVPVSYFGEAGRFVDLRSKKVLFFDRAEVLRVSLAASGKSVTAERGSTRGTWNYVKDSPDAAAVRLSDSSVDALIGALADVEAVGVEALAGTAEDFARCGLDAPAFTLAVELAGGTAVRRSIVLGGAAPGGGRYATSGGADAIFIVSRKTVAALTAPLTE